MSDIKLSTCCSCGFQWPTGQHGEHSCSSYLRAENTNLKARIVELEALVKEADDYLNINTLTSIGSGSIIHSAFKQALEQAA